MDTLKGLGPRIIHAEKEVEMSVQLDVQHELVVMDGTGDSKLMWDSEKKAEVDAAKQTYNDLKKKGYMAYKVKRDGSQGELLDEFDAEAEKIIMAPRMQGG